MKTRILSILLLTSVLCLPFSGFAQEYGRAGRQITNAGVPVNGTNELHTLTFGGTPTGGTFKLTFAGTSTTAAITWSATNATLVANIDAALEAMGAIGTGGVTTAVGTMTAGIGTITVTFDGTNTARRPWGLMTITSSLTGTSPTLADVVTTAGVQPTGGRATELGAILVDTTNGFSYINTGAPPNISWMPDIHGVQSYQVLTDGATVTIVCDNRYFRQNSVVTLGGNRTLAITGAANGSEGTLIVKQDGTGSRTLALPAGSKVDAGGAGAITLTATASAIDVLHWRYDGTNYFWTKNLNNS